MAPPSPPTITQVDRGFVAPNVSSFLIAYTSVGAGAEYEIHVFDGTSNSIFGPSSSLTQSIGLSPAGGTYTITIRARILAQDPGWSAFANAPNNPYTGLTSAPVAPDVPTGLTVTPNFDTEAYFVLDWADNAQPTTGALMMPRGGVTAAGIPSNARFGQAYDLNDLLSVNTHVGNDNQAWWVNHAALFADIGELRCRHFRDSFMGSAYATKSVPYENAVTALRNRNNAIPAGQQVLLWDTFFPVPKDFAHIYNFGGLSGDDALDNRWNVPLVFQRMDVGGVVPVPWEMVSMVAGPNEQASNNAANARAYEAETYTALRAASRANIPVAAGHSVVTTAGRQTGATVSQVPKAGPALINNGVRDLIGDLSTGRADLGDHHPYHVGVEWSHEQFDNKAAPDYRNSNNYYGGGVVLPKIMSEFGHISAGIDAIAQWGHDIPPPANGYAHDGYWPAPDDVIAEYMVRTLLLAYYKGMRRVSFYDFYNDGPAGNSAETSFGLVSTARVKKQQFYALKNFQMITGHNGAPIGQEQALPYSITGFTAGPANNHIAMFTGRGDPGYVAAGGIYHTNADRLDSVQVQLSTTQWLIFLFRQAMLWDREPGNWSTTTPGTGVPVSLGNVSAGRKVPVSRSPVLRLPLNVTTVEQCQPAAGGPGLVIDASNEALGRTFTNKTSSLVTTATNKELTVPMTGYTQAIRVTV